MNRCHPATLQALDVYALSIVGKTLRSRLVARLRAHGFVLSDMALLATLSDEGPCSQRAVASQVRADPADVTRSLERLEQRRLVTRERDSAVRRRFLVTLTAGGHDVLGEMVAAAESIADEAAAVLSVIERRALQRALRKLVVTC